MQVSIALTGRFKLRIWEYSLMEQEKIASNASSVIKRGLKYENRHKSIVEQKNV